MPRLASLLTVLAAVFVAVLAAPLPALGAQQAGVQAHLLWGGVSSAEMDRQLDLAKDAGAGVVRVDVGWQTLEESGKGQWSQWYLREMDAVVAKAEARGIRLIFTLLETPCWASSAPDTVKQGCEGAWWERGVNRYPPRNVDDYADALRYLVARYRGRVAAWEVWNEPNLKGFWNTATPAADYVRLIKAAYPAAKAADPGATILGGILSESDVPFAEALYANGIKGSFDGFSVHPYSHDFSPTIAMTGSNARSSFVSGVPAIREVMVRNGDPKPMWLTEFGWSTSSVRGSEMWFNGVDESVQADYLRQAYSAMRAWDYVEVGVWFNLRNWNTSSTERDANFGLVRHDYSPKPAYAAFKAASAELGQGTLAAAPAPTATATTTPTTSTTTPGTAKPRNAGAKNPRKALAASAYRATSSCRGGRLRVRGTAPKGSRVRVQVFRARTFRGTRLSARAVFTRVVRARSGRFAVTPPRRALKGCRYTVRASRVARRL